MLLVQLRIELVDPWSEVGGIPTEGNIEVLQEFVAAGEQGLGGIGSRINTRLTIENNDTVCQVCCHDEIVLHDEGGLL